MAILYNCVRSGCAALAAIALQATTARATVYNWDGSSSALFGFSQNWTPVGVPGSGDTVETQRMVLLK